MKFKQLITSLIFLGASLAGAQVFSTLYLPTSGGGLTLNIAAGRAFCGGVNISYAAGTLSMTASTTNYVYLNTSSSCVPAVKTTSFVVGDIPIATVVTGISTITSVTDQRSMFSKLPTVTGIVSAGITGQVAVYTGSNTVGGANSLSLSGTLAAGTTVLVGDGQSVVNFEAVGGKCDGVTDDTAALNAADAALQAGTGGTIQFPTAKTCLIAGHVVLPNDATNALPAGVQPISRQVPIHWTSASGDERNGNRLGPTSKYHGTQLLMTYSGNGATGPLAEQSIFTGGSGYAVGDTGTVGGTCSGATYTVEAVDTGTYLVGTARTPLVRAGWVEQVYISNRGTSCTVADNTATTKTTGSGTGLTINIAAVDGGAFAKIETYGDGLFEIDHLLLRDNGTDSLPFLRSTATTLNIHDMQFWGTGNFKQDALVLGGTTFCFNYPTGPCAPINSPLVAWQGYDTKIDFVNFSGIRRSVLEQAYASSTKVTNSYIDASSGTLIPGGAAFEVNMPILDSITGASLAGAGGASQITQTRFEMINYYYAAQYTSTLYNYFSGNDIEDVDLGPVTPYGLIHSQAGSIYNLSLVPVAMGLPVDIADVSSQDADGSSKSTLISSVADVPSNFPTDISSPNITGWRGVSGSILTATGGVVKIGDLAFWAASSTELDLKNAALNALENLRANSGTFVDFLVSPSLYMPGATSGGVSLQVPAVAGTTTITFPAASGTVALVTPPPPTIGLTDSSTAEWLHVYSLGYVTATGTLEIILPAAVRWSSTTATYRITFFNYSPAETGEVLISGYNNVGGAWSSSSAVVTGSVPFTSIRLADNGTNNVILLGTTTSSNWNGMNVSVDVLTGYDNYSSAGWGTGWSSAFLTSEAGITVSSTPSIYGYTGTCLSTTTLTVVNGIITGCS